jgi:hypothetical protein
MGRLAPVYSRRRKSDPWEHLREDRYPPDTFLRRLSRADYQRIFPAAA